MANTAQKAILYLLYRGGLCDEMEHTGIYKIL